MYIKQIIIQGFKSYKDQIVVEPFSPRHNVVVGRNGSGKSNFFSAIRFVLNDAYTKMTQEEKQALLHDSSNTLGMTTYVEIIFDNGDHRFPTGKDEVVLRRAISTKKDEYYLDHKSVTKSEVINFLQSAGFSTSNPYYIVPQGRITALTNARDDDRLQLLKEVAGTKVYEEHREESLKLISETDSKKEKISQLLSLINEKISVLEIEKEDLKHYVELDKQKRSCEFNLFHREQNELIISIEQLEDHYKNEIQASSSQRKKLLEQEHALMNLELELKKRIQELNFTTTELEDYLQQEKEENKKKLFSQMKLDDWMTKNSRNFSSEASINEHLASLSEKITQKEQALSLLQEKDNALKATEQGLQCQLTDLKELKASLLLKQGRSQQFSSLSERDEWLTKEISLLQKSKDFNTQALQSFASEASALELSSQEITTFLQTSKEKLKALEISLSELENEHESNANQRDQLIEERKKYWREESKLASFVPEFQEELLKQERHIYGTLDKNTSYGLEAVRQICQEHNLQGVHGPVYELFQTDDIYLTCVEIIASQSLFHVVVDNDEIASKILNTLIKEKTGRVTFIPLNRIKFKQVKYPDDLSQGIPMINILKFDPQYTNVMNQIFSKAVIVPSLEIGASLGKSFGLNVITLEGDRADTKGALTGGFIDYKNSRLQMSKEIKKNQGLLSSYKDKILELKEKIMVLDQNITTKLGHIQNFEISKKKLQGEKETIEKLIASNESLLQENAKLYLEKDKKIKSYEAEIKNFEIKINGLQEEIGTKLNAKLNKQEKALLENSSKEIANLNDQLLDSSVEKTNVSMQIHAMEHELKDNLKKRQHELTNMLKDLQSKAQVQKTQDSLKSDLSNSHSKLLEIKINSDRLLEDKSALEASLGALKKKIETLQTSHSQNVGSGFENRNTSHFLTGFISKKNSVEEKKDTLSKKIRELGLIPEDALSNYQTIPTNEIIKKLQEVNEKLKDFSHVNKKAYEQYTNFTKQRENLIKRKEELDLASGSIIEFIESLDAQKDEVVQRTFDTVSQNFTEIFSKLVPNGQATLVIQRNLDNPPPFSNSVNNNNSIFLSQRSQALLESSNSPYQYSGIGIQVSFNAKSGTNMRMQQLSGGQKSIVSLALIFAIQKCDPAPFYLFDEIDANLDASYRASVAALILELSKDAQFIITTFRSEMLTSANKFYGVIFNNRISRIESITKEAALEFIEQDENEPPKQNN